MGRAACWLLVIALCGVACTKRPEPVPVAYDPPPVEAVIPEAEAEPAQSSGSRSDADIRRLLIAQSAASYGGSCPCPYYTDRGGRSCGQRSAYSRPGGASPLCFPKDVSADMVAAFRARQPPT